MSRDLTLSWTVQQMKLIPPGYSKVVVSLAMDICNWGIKPLSLKGTEPQIIYISLKADGTFDISTLENFI